MKKTFFKSVLCASLFVGALTSCNEVEDLYNPELARERAQEAFGLPVDPNHDWNMISVVTANITLNEDALSDYSFRIYTANPIDKDSGATILADYPVKTDAQGKASASFKFEMPSYLEYVYVARVDSYGRRIVGVADIKNGAISKVFGVSTSTSTRADITDYNLPTMATPYDKTTIDSLIETATDVNNIELYNNAIRIIGNVVINSTVNGTINFNAYYYDGVYGPIYGYGEYGNENKPPVGANKLIIASGATLEITNEQQCSGMDIIVAEGGTLKINGLLKMQDNARIIVMAGGSVINEYDASLQDNEQNTNINFSNGNNTLIYNDGTINIGIINVSNGATIYNTANGQINAKTINLSGGLGTEDLINWGKIEAGRIVGNWGNGSQGAMHNGCLIRTNEINVLVLNLKNNAAIETTNFTANQIYLRENSIVRCENFSSNSPTLYQYVGVDGGKALISTKHVKYLNLNTSEGAPRQIYDNIYFEANTYNDNWYEQCLKILMSKTNIGGVCAVGEAPLVILSEATNDIADAECTGNGNKPNDYVEDVEPTIFTYAFEDTDKGAGDYDFNDVVIKCSVPVDNKITVTLSAVGATKRINLMFQLRDNDGNIIAGTTRNVFDTEVHAAFPDGATENFINTIKGNPLFECPSVEIEVPEGFTYKNNGDFFINVVNSSATSHIPQFTDNYEDVGVPYAILVPDEWRYPQEWKRVDSAYGQFATWAANALESQEWYTTDIDESKVY